MKISRNNPCPCGSGKKYKHCCIDSEPSQKNEMLEEVEQLLAMNPNLSLDELNAVLQHRVNEQNNKPETQFCGLSPTQMTNLLYAPFNELTEVTITTPDDLSTSPVMCYLELMLDEAMANGGSFKATSKGNLPTKIVKRATELLPEFAVSEFNTNISINEFAGSNEDKFNALHYTRVLAEMTGILYLRKGHYHVKKTAQKQYQTKGTHAFFLPMLETITTQYNWGYFDGFQQDLDLRTFWLFMLWRLQSHQNVAQLTEEVATAFPDLLLQIRPDQYASQRKRLGTIIETRFIRRFLEFWGFVTLAPAWNFSENALPKKAQIQPLLGQAFQFNI